jgi:imidazolonepropionase-like amidohydrolase
MIAVMWLFGAAFAAAPCVAVTDVVVHTRDGAHAHWSVSWQDGKIVSVGPQPPASSCERTSLEGGHLTPAWIAVGTRLGVMGVDQEEGTHDFSWAGAEVRAAFSVVESYDPRSVVVGISRLGGIGTEVVFPSGGMVAGTAGAVWLGASDWRGAAIRPYVAMVTDPLSAGSVGAGLLRLRELIDDAAVFEAAKDKIDVIDALSADRLSLAAIAAARRSDLPWVVRADRASDLEAVLRFRVSGGPRLVIVGAAEGWMVASALAEAKAAVVLDPFVYGAGSFDQTHGREDNAALLRAAGVDVILGAPGTHNARALRFAAGNAVRGGMRHDDAIAAITRVPAEVFGLAGRGVIEAGATADLALWTGDPLDTPGRLSALYLGGSVMPEDTRQTELVDAWRTLPRVWGEAAVP